MFVHCSGPKFSKCENTEKSRLDGAFMGKDEYNTEFSVETRLKHGFAIENTYVFPVKVTFCALFSLVQIVNRFTAAYSSISQNNAIFIGKL